MKKFFHNDPATLFFLTFALLFAGLRFIKIEADFPQGIEKGGVLYTDEGWYANGAINHVIDGKWYKEGDFNTMVNLPINHLLQRAAFALFGMSLATARGTVILFFILLLFFVFYFTKTFTDTKTASFAVFLLSVNYSTFAYSRLAILEITMLSFTAAALLGVASFRKTNHYLVIVISSILLVIAALTKSTALFAVPILLYLAILRGTTRVEKIVLPLLALIIITSALFFYTSFAVSTFPEDYSFFTKGNFSDRMQLNPAVFFINVFFCLISAYHIEPIAYPIGVLLCIFLLFRSVSFRKSIIVHIALIWIIVYSGIIGSISYHPARYFLPLSLPAALLFSYGVFSLDTFFKKENYQLIFLFVVTYFLTFNGFRIIRYLNTSHKTFITMTREIKKSINSDNRNAILIGNCANSISCATGIRSINTVGTQSLEWRLNKYHPNFYISVGIEPAVIKELSEKYTLRPVKKWDVFNNYFLNKKVHLYKLDNKKDTTLTLDGDDKIN